MGLMKDFLITIHNGGDEAVAAVQRMGDDWRIQLEQAASELERQWIAVTERLPSTRCRVLVVWGLTGHIAMAWFRPEKKRKRFLYEVDGFNDIKDSQSYITHWMPLPAPPTASK